MFEDVHRGAVDGFEDRWGEYCFGAASAGDAHVETEQLWEMSGCAIQVVGAEHDGEPVVVELAQEVKDFVACSYVDTGRGFVEEQDLRFAEKGAGDEHALLLSSGQLADVAMTKLTDAEAIKDDGDVALLRCAGPRSTTPVDSGHRNDLGDRNWKVPVDRLDLGHVADS